MGFVHYHFTNTKTKKNNGVPDFNNLVLHYAENKQSIKNIISHLNNDFQTMC